MRRRTILIACAIVGILSAWPFVTFGQQGQIISLKEGLVGEKHIEIDKGAEDGVKMAMKGHVYFLHLGDLVKIAFFVVTRVEPRLSEARILDSSITIKAGHFVNFDEPLVPPLPEGFLVVSSSAGPATLSIEGKKIGATSDRISYAPGTYKLRVTKEGYRDHEETIAIDAGRETKIEVKLGRIPETTYKVFVTSVPDGAKVSLNGMERGLTPLPLYLPRNSYRIRIEKEGYRTVEESLAVAKDIPEKPYPLEKLGLGTIEFDAYPPAELEIDGVPYGEVPPILKVTLSEGPHKIRLNYFRQQQVREHTIIVTKEKTEAKRFRLDVALILAPVI